MNVRPEIQALIDRGDVTTAEIAELRCNSWEWEALVPAMTDEALIDRAEHALKNVWSSKRRPFVTYDESIKGLWMPELLKRLRTQQLKNDEAEVLGFAEGFGEAVRSHEKAMEKTLSAMTVADAAVLRGEHSAGRNVTPETGDIAKLKEQLAMAKREINSLGEVLDDIRKALGQKDTHYLVMADDVKALVEAVGECNEDGNLTDCG